MKRLESNIENYYSQQQLDPSRLQSILSQSRPRRAYRWFAVAALLMMCVAVAVIYQQHRLAQIDQRILQEASLNHRSKLQMDVEASKLGALSDAMNRLDFALALPERLSTDYQLLGGRYCTLNGELAVHLRLSDNVGKEQISLFVTADGELFDGLGDRSELLDGVAVSSWSENGQFYVLAFN